MTQERQPTNGGTPPVGTGQPGSGGQITPQGPNDPLTTQQPGTGSADGQEQDRQPDNFDAYRRTSEERITTLIRQRDEATRLLEEEKRKGLAPDEIARLRALDEEAKRRDERERSLILRYEIAARAPKLGIVDPEVAVMLLEKSGKVTVNPDQTVSGVDEALKELVKDKPFLVQRKESVDGGAGSGGTRTGQKATMNDIIRGAARGRTISGE